MSKEVTSEVNLQITITHERNLPANSEQIAAAVSQYLARILDVGPGNATVVHGRHYESSGVDVFLRSAFIVRTNSIANKAEVESR